MKLLYSALNTLENEERKFLLDKYYRTDSNKPFNDPDMAKKYGITEKEYREQRIMIEAKLSKEVNRLNKN